METDTKKSSNVGLVLGIFLGVLAIALVGLFVYAYVDKSNELRELRAKEEADKDAKIKQILEQTQAYRNMAQTIPGVEKPGGLERQTEADMARARQEIAEKVSTNLEPVLKAISDRQQVTIEELGKIAGRLTNLLEEESKRLTGLLAEESKRHAEQLAAETKRRDDLVKKQAEAIKEISRRYGVLQNELNYTRETNAKLRSYSKEVGEKYIAEMQHDSVCGIIAEGAMVPALVLKNIITLDMVQEYEREEAKKAHAQKMKEYEAESQKTIAEPEPVQNVTAQEATAP